MIALYRNIALCFMGGWIMGIVFVFFPFVKRLVLRSLSVADDLKAQ